jgi:predicted RecA/RadA family phage recombinase
MSIEIRDSITNLRTLQYANAAAVAGGDIIVVNGRALIAVNATDAAADNAYVYMGKVSFTKQAGVAIDVGELGYWDATNEYVNKTGAGNTAVGFCIEAAALADTSVLMMMIPNLIATDTAADSIRQTSLDRRFIFEEFESNPVTSKLAGGASAGTTGTTNIMMLEENIFEYHVKGTQTIVAPSAAAAGLDVGMDQADNDGVEISQGITAKSRAAFLIGTDAFYAKCKFLITTVAGTDDCAFGFRTAEAYQANLDDYNNMAVLNVISGDIKIETIDDNAATTTTDTTDNWADGETHTFEIYVSAARAVTYKIDGIAPSVTAAFSWDNGDTVVPFFFMLQANAAQTGAVILKEWEVGLQ